MSDATIPEGMLYEVCVVCNGSGKVAFDFGGTVECALCKPLRVLPIGVTRSQLSKMRVDLISYNLLDAVGRIDHSPLKSCEMRKRLDAADGAQEPSDGD